MKQCLAWHFVGETLRDGRPIPKDGEILHHRGDLELCASGLHASRKIIDALNYAPGNTVCRVRVSGKILEDSDKLVASKRVILWRIDAESVLRSFSRSQALSVAHLWKMPDIVRRYLETGDESLRAAARAAARDAAWAAAWDAARAVARDAANKQLQKLVMAARKGGKIP